MYRSYLIMVLLLFIKAVVIADIYRPNLRPGHDYVYVCQDANAGGYEAFPDVCRLSDGRLICVFYAGYSHISQPCKRFPKGGRISYCLSTDEGKTWSESKVLYDSPLDDRDPSIAQLSTGRLVCSFFIFPDKGCFVIYSDDGGQTWPVSQRRRVGILYNVSSPPRELSTGRLVMGLYSENKANGMASGAAATSDDFGISWTHLAVMDNAGKYLAAETDIIELKDGILFAVHRGDKGAQMHWTTSIDQGLNWGRTKPIGFQGNSPYLHRTENGIVILAYRQIESKGNCSTALRYSLDECRTWFGPIKVDSVGGAYPSLVNLKDGPLLIVYYEEGHHSNIRARKFTINRFGVKWLSF